MTAMFSGEKRGMDVVGSGMNGTLPSPIQAFKQGSVGNVMSDMQLMAQNERKQHEDTYKYEYGHNDHGLGQ